MYHIANNVQLMNTTTGWFCFLSKFKSISKKLAQVSRVFKTFPQTYCGV